MKKVVHIVNKYADTGVSEVNNYMDICQRSQRLRGHGVDVVRIQPGPHMNRQKLLSFQIFVFAEIFDHKV